MVSDTGEPPERDERSADGKATTSFREAWADNKRAATSCRCTHMCLASTSNIAKTLVEAVAKAAVFQTAGKPFADPMNAVSGLSAELVKTLMADGSHVEGSAGVLSDLAHEIDEWTVSKKTFFSNAGSLLATGTQADAIDKLRVELARADAKGFNPSDRERMSRELLLRVGPSATLPFSFGVKVTRLYTEYAVLLSPKHLFYVPFIYYPYTNAEAQAQKTSTSTSKTTSFFIPSFLPLI